MLILLSAGASHRMILPPLASRAVLPALGGSAGRLGVPLASVNEAPASLPSLLLALNDGESTRPVSDIFENAAAAAYIAVLWVLFGGLAYLAYGDYQQRQRKSEGLAQMETCALASALPKRTHTLAHACTRMACPAAEHLSSCRAFVQLPTSLLNPPIHPRCSCCGSAGAGQGGGGLRDGVGASTDQGGRAPGAPCTEAEGVGGDGQRARGESFRAPRGQDAWDGRGGGGGQCEAEEAFSEAILAQIQAVQAVNGSAVLEHCV